MLVAGSVLWYAFRRPARAAGEPSSQRREPAARLERLDRDTLHIPLDLLLRLGVTTTAAQKATEARKLPPLHGCLALSNDRLVRVHSRFAGEIISIEEVMEAAPSGTRSTRRPLRFGDQVKKGQLLAVVWSKDLGEKKSDLVDALSKLQLDRETLKQLEMLKGVVPERSLREAERNVETDLVAAARAERALRSWRLSDEEIASVRAEAQSLRGPAKAGDKVHETWARVEVRAPQDGMILEKNVSAGDIVDTNADLFKIGDLSCLAVWAHVYEDDLRVLEKLRLPTPWTVRIPAAPGLALPGHLEQIGPVVDQNQHTALVLGHVDNPNGTLKVGQFITATVTLPPPADEVEVPADAVVEDGRESIVFVRPDPSKLHFIRRRVMVSRRFQDKIYLRGDSIRPGDQVVTGAALLLRQALDELPLPKADEPSRAGKEAPERRSGSTRPAQLSSETTAWFAS